MAPARSTGAALVSPVVWSGAGWGLLGLTSFVVGAVVTGGIGPWLPFQMLALAFMGATAGAVGRRTAALPPPAEVVVLVVFGWLRGFLFGAIMNLWFWPFAVGDGPLAWRPGLSVGETADHYCPFYVATSLAWDAAGATANAIAIALLARPVLRTLRRFAHRLDPVTELDPLIDTSAGR